MQDYLDDYDYQLKFVVESGRFRRDLQYRRTLKKCGSCPRFDHGPGDHAETALDEKAGWIVECLRYGYSFTPRLHIELFGNRRGT